MNSLLVSTNYFHQAVMLAGVVLVSVSACGTSEPNRDEMMYSITTLESEVSVLMSEIGRSSFSLERTVELRDAYIHFADTFVGDSLSAEFLYQAAMIDADIHDDVKTGIQYLERLVDEYPDHELTAKTLFIIGFTYAEQLNDYNKARDAYNRYLDKYPEGDMAESVKIELETLGMRPVID